MGDLVVYAPDKIAGIVLCRFLKKRDMEPFYYNDEEDFLKKIRFGIAEIIILDFSSFSSMCEIVRDIENIMIYTQGIPVIIITPYSSNEKELAHFNNKGYHIIEKPVCIEHLASLISQLKNRNVK